MTAAQLRALLRRKYAPRADGTGLPEHLLIFEVGVDDGPAAPDLDPAAALRLRRRRIDAVAVGLWTRTEHQVHGFELKASRADLLAELRQPEKAAAGVTACDTWTLLLAPGVLRDGDRFPDGWGVLVPAGRGLRWHRHPDRRVGRRDPRFHAGLLQASLRSHGICRGLGVVEGRAQMLRQVDARVDRALAIERAVMRAERHLSDVTLRLVEADPPRDRRCSRCQREVQTRRYPDLSPPAVFHDCLTCRLTWERDLS